MDLPYTKFLKIDRGPIIQENCPTYLIRNGRFCCLLNLIGWNIFEPNVVVG